MKRRLLLVCMVTWAACGALAHQVVSRSTALGLEPSEDMERVDEDGLPELAQAHTLQMPSNPSLPPPQPENATWQPHPPRQRRNSGRQQQPPPPPNNDPRHPPPPPSPRTPHTPIDAPSQPLVPPGGPVPPPAQEPFPPPGQQYQQPIAIPATCVCYPTGTQVPGGFGSIMGYASHFQPHGNYPSQNIALNSQSRSSAQANVETPTYVQVFKDDTMDPVTAKFT